MKDSLTHRGVTAVAKVTAQALHTYTSVLWIVHSTNLGSVIHHKMALQAKLRYPRLHISWYDSSRFNRFGKLLSLTVVAQVKSNNEEGDIPNPVFKVQVLRPDIAQLPQPVHAAAFSAVSSLLEVPALS